jgi:lysophospholipase L1-like esterase
MNGLIRKLVFAASMTVLGLVLLEVGARVVDAQMPPPQARPLPAPGDLDCMPDCLPGAASMPEQPRGLPRGIPMSQHGRRAWALPANTEMVETNVRTRVNSLSLRGPDLGPKRSDEKRLMTLGDSSVFGFGVDEAAVFGAVASARLTRTWGAEVTSVNGGTPGYTSVQALQTLQDVGLQVQPDIVVIATLWSDLFQTDAPIERAGGRKHPSALYRLTTRALAPWLPAPTVGWLEGDNGAPALGREARVGLERYRQTLDSLVSVSRQLGATPVVLILPAPADLDSEPLPSTISAYRKELRLLASRHGLVLVDGAAIFRKMSASNADFYDQVHPSVSGHLKLGEALADSIERIGADL